MKKAGKIALAIVMALTLVNCGTGVTRNTSSPLSGRMQYAPTNHYSPAQNTSSTSLVKYNFAELEKEYKSFSTKALAETYVKRMFGKYLTSVNSVQLTRQLEFARYLKTNADTSYETSLKNMFTETPSLYGTLTGISAIQTKMAGESATFGAFVLGLSPYAYAYVSCKALRNSGVLINGVYLLNQDNNISTSPINAYCDMTTDGGGWTLVAAQYESDPVPNWDEGIQSDYDPTLATNKGFTLNSSQLPVDRTEIAFGQDLNPTGVDYADFVYTTGNIDSVTVTGKKNTSYSYQIDRDLNHHHAWHNPEASSASNSMYDNTLTFDKTGGYGYNWAFSPKFETTTIRGYSYNGLIYSSDESFAWTLWVR